MTVEIIKTAAGLELVSKADYDKVAARLEMINALMDVAKEANEHAKAGFLAMQADYDKLAAECAALKSAISYVCDTDNLPDYQHEGMGCGIEDRGIIDRYDAARYGWDEAMERIYSEVISFAGDIKTPATDAAIAELKARGVDEFAESFAEMQSKTKAGSRLEMQLAFTGGAAVSFAAQLRADKDGE